MAKLDASVKKEISKYLNTAIDCELASDFEQAYRFYVEGLYLVAEVLKKDLSSQQSELTLRDKCNLIQFSKQSLGRITGLLGGQDSESDGKCDGQNFLLPSAPPDSNCQRPSPPPPYSPEDYLPNVEAMMARYQRRLCLASSDLEKQKVDMEMTHPIFESTALTRNDLIRTTAWAMQNAHKKFQIQEKLSNGKLKTSDFRKQQLFTISLQFHEGNTWLFELQQDLNLYPNNEKATRDLLDLVLTDNSHPIKATINQMQDKVTEMITDAIINIDPAIQANLFDKICKEIKEDINIIHEVLKALFEPLKTAHNSILTSESIHHVYFSQIKPLIISLINQDRTMCGDYGQTVTDLIVWDRKPNTIAVKLFLKLAVQENLKEKASRISSTEPSSTYEKDLHSPSVKDALFLVSIRIIHRDVKLLLEKKIKTGLPEELAGNWNDLIGDAVSKLHYLTTLHNPYDMLTCTVHIIKSLADIKFDDHCTSIGADDLLPRLCQVVITSGLPYIYAEAYFMEAFMPSEKALGEEGYAVTMLQSAIAHLTNIVIIND